MQQDSTADEDDDELALEVIDDYTSGDNQDWYVAEAADANLDAGFIPANRNSRHQLTDIHYSMIPLKSLMASIDHLKKNNVIDIAPSRHVPNRQPTVFFTSMAEVDCAISNLAQRFTLNREQKRALTIVARHSIGFRTDYDQLLMGTFGEGGTGKSCLIEVIREWFALTNQINRLIVTATTGAAAVRINGSTLHSAVGIAVENYDSNSAAKTSDKDILAWKEIEYVIIDEVSMMDAKVMIKLNEKLNKLKAPRGKDDGKPFGGTNILFFGDFYQLPAVSRLDLWRKSLGRWSQGHDLWRSLNAVVVLTKQMRQADDPAYAEAMSRIRLHAPTDDDIRMLNSRIGVPIPNAYSSPIIVRRHSVRHAINLQRLKEMTSNNGLQIVHCKAEISDLKGGFSIKQALQIIYGPKKALGDGVLSLIPGAPVMVTKNLNYLPIRIVNGAILEFYGFAATESPNIHISQVINLPDYILLRLPSEKVVLQIDGLPANIIPVKPERFQYIQGHGRSAKVKQFPISLAYAISDYKSQGQTYNSHRVDIKRPNTGTATVMSPYVQLSRGRSLEGLSILRPFDPSEMREPIPEELTQELKWEEEMAVKTAALCP